MSNEFKKCPNGHYYQGSQCPYCKSSGGNVGNSESHETLLYGNDFGNGSAATETVIGPGVINASNKTTVVGNGGFGIQDPKPTTPSSHTVFGDEYDSVPGDPTSAGQGGGFRETRKLVGWLVSYTLDAMGVDYKLYEGRNVIGRSGDCSISVNDNMISSKHAVLLFRAGKYSITDSQSSHGTFVNDRDIDLEPCYLQDGDMIRMGKTLFKFRSSF